MPATPPTPKPAAPARPPRKLTAAELAGAKSNPVAAGLLGAKRGGLVGRAGGASGHGLVMPQKRTLLPVTDRARGEFTSALADARGQLSAVVEKKLRELLPNAATAQQLNEKLDVLIEAVKVAETRTVAALDAIRDELDAIVEAGAGDAAAAKRLADAIPARRVAARKRAEAAAARTAGR
jgi:hypothetical protein